MSPGVSSRVLDAPIDILYMVQSRSVRRPAPVTDQPLLCHRCRTLSGKVGIRCENVAVIWRLKGHVTHYHNVPCWLQRHRPVVPDPTGYLLERGHVCRPRRPARRRGTQRHGMVCCSTHRRWACPRSEVVLVHRADGQLVPLDQRDRERLASISARCAASAAAACHASSAARRCCCCHCCCCHCHCHWCCYRASSSSRARVSKITDKSSDHVSRKHIRHNFAHRAAAEVLKDANSAFQCLEEKRVEFSWR